MGRGHENQIVVENAILVWRRVGGRRRNSRAKTTFMREDEFQDDDEILDEGEFRGETTFCNGEREDEILRGDSVSQ